MRSRHRPLRYELLETRDLLTTVQISDAIVDDSAARVTVPVAIDDATGIRAAEIRIEYDTTQLEVHPKDIAAGSAWAGKGMAIANIDDQAGVIVAFVFAVEDVAGGAGSVIDVSFTIRSDTKDMEAQVDLAEVRLNEGQIELATMPISGADATDGSIAIKRNAIRHLDRPPKSNFAHVCTVGWTAESQTIFSQPVLHVPPIGPHHSTPANELAWLRRGGKFIGPRADVVFAATTHWLVER